MKKKLVQTAVGLFLLIGFTTSGFAQWTKTNWPATNSYFDLSIGQNKVLARTWDTLNGGRTYLSSDTGANWSLIAADSSQDLLSTVIVDTHILAGTWDGLIRTDINSTNWASLTPTGIPADTAICALATFNSTLYAGATGTLYKSSDNGDTWTEIKSGIPASARITSFAQLGDVILAGSDSSGVFRSIDYGLTWVAINNGLTDRHISQLVVNEAELYAVTLEGVFTLGSGSTWTKINLPNVNCMVVANNKLWAGTDTEGIYASSDNGLIWGVVTGTGMPANTRIWSLVAKNDTLIAGTSDGVWRAPITSIALPVESDDAPGLYVLERNYPNPFNPTTSIGFTIPASGKVTLTIYNVAGQKIRTLVDDPMSVGSHKVTWDGLTDTGVRAPSGVYLYELRAGVFRDTKKLLLMK